MKLQNDTVWLSLDQMAELFQRNKSTISRHIKNVLEDGELDEKEVVAFFATTTKHGAIEGKVQEHQVAFYNLDMIISVGYRVHSYRGVQFRIWATKVLKEYIVNVRDLLADSFPFISNLMSMWDKHLQPQPLILFLFFWRNHLLSSAITMQCL